MNKRLIYAALFVIFNSAQAQEGVPSSTVGANPPAMEAAPVTSVDATAQASSSNVKSEVQVEPLSTPPPQKRILGVVPNFYPVSSDTILPPQAPSEKLKVGLESSFDYSSFVLVGIQAGIKQGTDAYPAFHQGAAGYGRYYWHGFADWTDENLLVKSLLPVVFHEDSRYYNLSHGGVLKRAGYALSRAVITRNDNGSETFNVSEIVGSGAAAGISSIYYPGQYRTWTKTGQRWLSNVITDGAAMVAKEFWPDISRKVFRRKN